MIDGKRRPFNLLADLMMYLMVFPAAMYFGIYLWYYTNGTQYLVGILAQALLAIPVGVLWKVGKGRINFANNKYASIGSNHRRTWIHAQFALYFLVFSAFVILGIQAVIVCHKHLIPEIYFDIATTVRWFVAILGMGSAFRLFYASRGKVE